MIFVIFAAHVTQKSHQSHHTELDNNHKVINYVHLLWIYLLSNSDKAKTFMI